MPTLASLFETLVAELDATHTEGGFKVTERISRTLPNFTRTRSGAMRHFSEDAQVALDLFSEALYRERERYREVARVEEFIKAVRVCVADLHAEGALSTATLDDKGRLQIFEGELSGRVLGLARKYTHVFPAHTLRLEHLSERKLGPVRLLSVSAWLSEVDYPEAAKERLGLPVGAAWKEHVLAALKGPASAGQELPRAANEILAVLQGCDAVVCVDVEGRELAYSREIARLAARTALDGITLLANGGRKFFLQQALRDERLPPVDAHSVIVTEGLLWSPGYRLTDRFNHVDPARIDVELAEQADAMASLGKVVAALVEPTTHSHPNLAARWATALEWFAEGCRETSDAVAVTKLASALDVLACGGKNAGIRDMVSHLTGASASDVVVPRRGTTLAALVARVYDDGRSKLLHGTHFDRLQKFSIERLHAQDLGFVVLTELLVRLPHYIGADVDKAFRTMAPAPTAPATTAT